MGCYSIMFAMKTIIHRDPPPQSPRRDVKSLKLVMFCAALTSAAVCTAADATYVWPDDLATANEITVEYDTTDPTKVKTLTATVAAGDAVTLTGGTIDFAADAVVKLSGPGGFAIENTLTGVNGLTVTNAENACILNYNDGLLPSKTFKTIFPGVDLDDIIILYGDQRTANNVPGMSNNQIHYPHFVRRMTVDGVKMMTMQMRRLLEAAGQPVPEDKFTLELNPEHKLVKKAYAEMDEAVFAKWATLIYNQALLADQGAIKDPSAFVKAMNELLLD